MISRFLRPADEPADTAGATVSAGMAGATVSTGVAGTAGEAGWPVAVFHGTLADWAPRDGDGVAWSRLLGGDEQRYAAMRNGGARARFAAARRLLKHVCAARLGIEPADVEIGYLPGGRPYLVGAGMPQVSISHTRDIVAVAVGVGGTGGTVGVDVEHVDRPLLDYGLAPRMCTRREQQDLAVVPARWRNRYLVRLWTVKEAYVKALGTGLAADLRRVGFRLHVSPHGLLARPYGDTRGEVPPVVGEWRFRLTTVAGGYALACAVHVPGTPPSPPRLAPPHRSTFCFSSSHFPPSQLSLSQFSAPQLSPPRLSPRHSQDLGLPDPSDRSLRSRSDGTPGRGYAVIAPPPAPDPCIRVHSDARVAGEAWHTQQARQTRRTT
jgi:4'-phosphopantetheinyl transferase